ncbi:MAG: T9SS type A sorting domain-containing protein [Bacteroidetes bacterium]|nr:T9SS type A sorting domain-containing protein [Bacteroidota bacterium]
MFSLDFNNSDADLDDCELEVIDIKGRLVSRSNIIGKGIVKQQLSLAPGKYYVRLSFAESTWVKSFVVK